MTQAMLFSTADGRRLIGRVEGDEVVTAHDAPREGFIPDESGWQAIRAADGERFAVADVSVHAPVAPPKIIAIGLNYMGHVEETNLAKPEVPVVFAKWSSSITGPFDPIVIPREETRTDYEGEIGVVIGKRAYRVGLDEAWDVVGGFTALNDVSGRRAQLETPMRQFTVGKSFDTFTPIGPVIASVDSVRDRDNLTVRTTINDVEMQSSSSDHLIFSVAEIIEYVSRGITLEPGDVIATGTPGGVGDERKPPRYLLPGDVVRVEVEGVGAISNPVVAES